jgi:hypothetical protein
MTTAIKELNVLKVKMMLENPIVINDHNGKEEGIIGLVEFNNPDKGLACCFYARYYSLNACELRKDNKLHCSTYSIGGVLWGKPTEEQIKKYNESVLLDSAKIKKIYLADGAILSA